MRSATRFAKRSIWFAVGGVSIYLVIPSVIDVFSSWPELERLRSGSLVIMSGLMLASLASLWVLLSLCLHTREWKLMAMSQLASSAVARIVPGGAATATAV
jgi:hypothetical protein